MSMLVARMEKMKADNLVGCGNHNLRLTKGHSNKDIDVERSYLNYDIRNVTQRYKVDIMNYVNQNKASKKSVRKDAVIVNEWIISSDRAFFENLGVEGTKRYFEAAVSYFGEKFGIENVRYAQVHLDETTPHMHLGIVPFTKDWKLSAKTVFNKQTLKDIQDELPKYLQERGFVIERGVEGSQKKHLDTPEYKALQKELEEVREKVKQEEDRLKELNFKTKMRMCTLAEVNNDVRIADNKLAVLKKESDLEFYKEKNSEYLDRMLEYSHQAEELQQKLDKANQDLDEAKEENNKLWNAVRYLSNWIVGLVCAIKAMFNIGEYTIDYPTDEQISLMEAARDISCEKISEIKDYLGLNVEELDSEKSKLKNKLDGMEEDMNTKCWIFKELDDEIKNQMSEGRRI